MRVHLLIGIGALCSFTQLALCQTPKTQTLFEALRQGEASTLRAAIKQGVDVNSRDAGGNTLLMHAALYGTAADLQFLLAHGADVNAANKAGHTALMRAIPDLGKIKLLVEHGADVNVSAGGTTPLLIVAGIRSAEDAVHYLIEHGADVRATDAQGSDAVMLAAWADAAGNLKILLDGGASSSSEAKVRQPPNKARTAKLDEATQDRLKKRVEGATALMNAARVDCETCVRLLLEHGADAKARTDAGLTALHHAAFKGNLVVVRLLLEAGAPVNVADDRGLTPLMMAANSRSKNFEVVRVLLDRGADIHAKDELGRTAAEWARLGARREIVEMLPAPEVVKIDPLKTAVRPAFKDVHEAVAKSLALLEESAPKFFPKSGCISCHNVSLPLAALSEGRRRGYPVKPATTQQLVKQTLATYLPQRDNLLSGACGVFGSPGVGSHSLIPLKAEGYAADALTDAVVRCLSLAQYPDGHTRFGIDARPPLSAEGDIPETALSARAMKSYFVPAMAGDLETKIARARAFLVSSRPVFGDDYAYRVFGLVWTDAAAGQIQEAARELIAQQRPDGGWAQNSDLSSDAYETGLSLSALAAADPGCVKSGVYRRGVDYLMRTQEADGSWHVHSRAFGFQPYFESGFPHDRDQWISMAATAWSAMALMPVAEQVRVQAAR
jgi:ankyrin repeat protein